jgi:hypothetical protein
MARRAFYLDICDALDRKSEAEQPSQQFSFFGSLKLIRQAYGRHVADLREADKTGAGQ